jgi:hypothetical protein
MGASFLLNESHSPRAQKLLLLDQRPFFPASSAMATISCKLLVFAHSWTVISSALVSRLSERQVDQAALTATAITVPLMADYAASLLWPGNTPRSKSPDHHSCPDRNFESIRRAPEELPRLSVQAPPGPLSPGPWGCDGRMRLSREKVPTWSHQNEKSASILRSCTRWIFPIPKSA